MRLVKLRVQRLPGIPEGFSLETDGGVTIVTGPNGSGKSSLTRAIRGLFWDTVETGAPFAVEADFEADGHLWKAAREDGRPTRWWPDGAEHSAPEVPGAFLERCYEMGVLDLVLPPGGEVERELASIINREMSGGVDLVAIAEDLFKDRSHQASRLRRPWLEARRVWQEALADQRRLADEESGLEELRRELADGERAAAQLPWWRDQRRRMLVRESLVGLEARLQAAPQGQDRVREDDALLLDRLLRETATTERSIQETEARREEQQRDLRELVWPAADPEVLAGRLEDLLTRDKEIRQAEEALTRAEARRRQAQQDLLPQTDGLDGLPAPSAAAYEKVARAYARLAARQGLKEGLETLLHLPEWQQEDDPAARENRLELLRALLLHPDEDKAAPFWLAWLPTLGLLGAGLWGWTDGRHTPGLVLAAVALLSGGLAGGAQWRQRARARQGRQERQEKLAALQQAGLDLPGQSSREELARQHEALATERGARAARQEGLAQIQGRRQALEAEASRLREELSALEEEEGLGLDLESPELLNLLQALPRLRAALEEEAAQRDVLKNLRQDFAALMEKLAGDLQAFGEGAPADLPAAQAALKRVRQREEKRRELQQEIRILEGEIGTLQRDAQRLESDQQEFWTRLGLPANTDRQVVADLVAGREAWQDLRDDASGQRALLTELDARLAETPAGLDAETVCGLEPAALDARIDTLEKQAQDAAELKTRIDRLEQRLETARADHRVAAAAAAEMAAREDLETARDNQRATILGRLLLEDVESSHQRATRPRVLEQAGRLFREFTGDLYELRVVPGPTRQGRFVAHDRQRGVDLGLAMISDGTRAQLLLAVRLAFITENEEGHKPPLFLDESLTSTDPTRFAAIARNLTRWADERQRQVFYLTSNPADATAWRAAQEAEGLTLAGVIDLAERRGLAAAAPLPDAVTAPPLLPPPGSLGSEEYARLLEVPTLDAWQPATAAHLWYLLFDDLELLHRLLMAASPTLGLFRARLDKLPVLADLSKEKADSLMARGAALEAFLALWKIGRGRPLAGHDLERCGQVSDRFLPECLALLKEHGGRAALLLQDLENRKVKGFRRNSLDQLTEFLEAEGFIDERDILGVEALVGRVQSQLMGEIRQGHLRTEETRHLVETWWRVLQACGQAEGRY